MVNLENNDYTSGVEKLKLLTHSIEGKRDRSADFDSLLIETCSAVNLANSLLSGAPDLECRNSVVSLRQRCCHWVKAYIAEHPHNRTLVSDKIQGLVKSFPWGDIRPPSSGLALLYNFSPFQDTGATVASKRLRNFGQSVDVIACSFLHKKKTDSTIEAIAEPYVNKRIFLPLQASWASWEPYRAFISQSNKAAESLIQAGAEYEFVYSRAMWAPSIYAGAIFKLNHPEIKWIAEFSDPLSLDVEGLPRGGSVPNDSFSEKLYKVLLKHFPNVETEKLNLFSLAEHLAYALADEIIFTNDNQKITMLDHIIDDDLRTRVSQHSIVSNHPTLPREYYEREETSYEVNPEKVNLGYFGEFYSSRGITEVTSAIRSLPPHIREKVNLHVFTNYIPPTDGEKRPRNFSQAQFDELVSRALQGVGADGIEHLVQLNASLPYLKFLATTETLDYLIVNDARSGEHHDVNPYLPSKWSDYSGSSAKTWAFVEDGSILSGKPATVKCPVGDVFAAREQLWRMVESKFPDTKDANK